MLAKEYQEDVIPTVATEIEFDTPSAFQIMANTDCYMSVEGNTLKGESGGTFEMPLAANQWVPFPCVVQKVRVIAQISSGKVWVVQWDT